MLDNHYKLKTILNRGKLLIQILSDVEPPKKEVVEEIEKNTLQWNTMKDILDTGDLVFLIYNFFFFIYFNFFLFLYFLFFISFLFFFYYFILFLIKKKILFSDTNWNSTLYENVVNQFSHVGIVVKVPQYNFMLVWEMVPEWKEEEKEGIQINEYNFSDFPLFFKQTTLEEKDLEEMEKEEKIDEIPKISSEESEFFDHNSLFLSNFTSRLCEISQVLSDKKFSRICFRKLNFNRSNETVEKLVHFRKETQSKFWLENLKKKIFRKQKNSSHQNLFDNSHFDKYVGGELVYGALKCIGLIEGTQEDDLSIHLPDHFSSREFHFKLKSDMTIETEKWLARKFNNLNQSYDLEFN